MATVRDYVIDAYRLITDLGLDESMSSAMASAGLKRANGIMKNWSNKRSMSYSLPVIEHILEANKQTYTIGPGGDIDTDRIGWIEYIRIDDNATFPTSKIVGPAKYNEWEMISSKKSSASWPQAFYYNPAYPLGELNLYPAPAVAYKIYITHTKQFTQFSDINDEVEIPEDLEELFTYTLCMKLAPYRGITVSGEVRREYSRLKYETQSKNRNLTPRMLLSTPFSGLSYNNRRVSFPWGYKR